MQNQATDQVTLLLKELSGGDFTAAERLLPLIYDELRRLAAGVLRGNRPDHTLQPTALVHEAYMRLVAHHRQFAHHKEFIAIAASAMRQVLIDHARRKRANKRGGGRQRVTLSPEVAKAQASEELDLIDLDEALKRLAVLDGRKCRVVELRYFGGLSNEETAEVLGVSRKTVVEDWTVARLWLKRELGGSGTP